MKIVNYKLTDNDKLRAMNACEDLIKEAKKHFDLSDENECIVLAFTLKVLYETFESSSETIISQILNGE